MLIFKFKLERNDRVRFFFLILKKFSFIMIIVKIRKKVRSIEKLKRVYRLIKRKEETKKMSRKEKRQVTKITVFLTSIFVIFLSVTYAFINVTLTGTKRQIINAGTLEVELEEENAITIENALPMYDETGMIQDAFVFHV